MSPIDFRPRKPNGWQLTEREEAISKVDKAVYGLASIFGDGPNRRLSEALFRLTDGHKWRMTAAMLEDLAIALELAGKLAVVAEKAGRE
ncbi:MAG: hypothetical protein J0I98_11550 [Mesorhizobium sp.]|nr:hypothetical protein [Mesorhizobium sp.]MBN9243419.1 hypothetical protein [Mesorhizobium sp.]